MALFVIITSFLLAIQIENCTSLEEKTTIEGKQGIELATLGTYIFFGVSFIFIIILCVLMCFFHLQKKRLEKQYKDCETGRTLSSWNYPESHLEVGGNLCGGYFGNTAKAVAPNILKDGERTVVVVKKLASYSRATNFLRKEMEIMLSLGKHANIVQFFGVSKSSNPDVLMYAIFEYCELGNLHSYIDKNKLGFVDQINQETGEIDRSITEMNELSICAKNLNLPQTSQPPSSIYKSDNFFCPQTYTTMDLLEWSTQIARGMKYLSEKQLIHCFLMLRNILLTQDRVAKIGDFEIARFAGSDDFTDQDKYSVPYEWMSIEYFRDGNFSTEGDVWSFGVLLWECFTLGKHPYGSIEMEKMLRYLVAGNRLNKPEYANESLFEMMNQCWREKKEERPSFEEIIKKLGNF